MSVIADGHVTPAARETRAKILDTALVLFTEHGFDGTTLQEIADRLGFTKAALYYHFKSKDDLLAALLTPAVDAIEELIAAHEHDRGLPGSRRRFIEAYIDQLLANRRLIAYMVSDLATIAHPVIADGGALRRTRLQALIAGEAPDFAQQVRVVMALRGIGGVIAQYPTAEPAALRDALLSAVASLLKVRCGRPHGVTRTGAEASVG